MEYWKCVRCGKKYRSKSSYDENAGLIYGAGKNKEILCVKCLNKYGGKTSVNKPKT